VRFLDTNGRVAIDLGAHADAGDFREGVAPVRQGEYLKGRTTFIDKNGRELFSVAGHAEEFSEGMALLRIKPDKPDPVASNEQELHGFIDRSGKVVIPPQFAEAEPFSEGLAAARLKRTTVWGMGNAWGYIDESGKFVTELQFNQAEPFYDGIARVHVGGVLHTPDDADFYWEGGQWQLIDRTGKRLDEPAGFAVPLWLGPRVLATDELFIEPNGKWLKARGVTRKQLADALQGRRYNFDRPYTVKIGEKSHDLHELAHLTTRGIHSPPFVVTLRDGRTVTVTPDPKRIGQYAQTGEYFEQAVRAALADFSGDAPGKVKVMGDLTLPEPTAAPHVKDDKGVYTSLGEPLETAAKVKVQAKP
jgi:hypothetical protein